MDRVHEGVHGPRSTGVIFCIRPGKTASDIIELTLINE